MKPEHFCLQKLWTLWKCCLIIAKKSFCFQISIGFIVRLGFTLINCFHQKGTVVKMKIFHNNWKIMRAYIKIIIPNMHSILLIPPSPTKIFETFVHFWESAWCIFTVWLLSLEANRELLTLFWRSSLSPFFQGYSVTEWPMPSWMNTLALGRNLCMVMRWVQLLDL